MTAHVPAWVAVAGVLLGYVVAISTEIVRGHQALVAAREERRDRRKADREDAHDAFERETLLALQDAAHAFMRNASKSMQADETEYRSSGRWGRSRLPDELGGEPSLELGRNVQRLRVRVLEEDLRERVGAWTELLTAATVGAMRDEPDVDAQARSMGAWSSCTSAYVEMMEKIGDRIRVLVSHWS